MMAFGDPIKTALLQLTDENKRLNKRLTEAENLLAILEDAYGWDWTVERRAEVNRFLEGDSHE